MDREVYVVFATSSLMEKCIRHFTHLIFIILEMHKNGKLLSTHSINLYSLMVHYSKSCCERGQSAGEERIELKHKSFFVLQIDAEAFVLLIF